MAGSLTWRNNTGDGTCWNLRYKRLEGLIFFTSHSHAFDSVLTCVDLHGDHTMDGKCFPLRTRMGKHESGGAFTALLSWPSIAWRHNIAVYLDILVDSGAHLAVNLARAEFEHHQNPRISGRGRNGKAVPCVFVLSL